MNNRILKFIIIITLLITTVSNCYSQTKKKSQILPTQGKLWNLKLPGAALPMSWIPPGKFIMGSPGSEPGRKADESPQTTVTLTKGYWMGTTHVTIGQWKALTGQTLREKVIRMLNDETLYDFEGKKLKLRDFMGFAQNDPDKVMANENDELPMYFVSWNEAMDFCRKLTERERAAGRLPKGYAYTLPTEAQWEYACRAGTTGPTYAGLDSIAWYAKNSFQGYTGKGLGNPPAGPRNAGEKLPNKWGLKDMSGNIWQWCRDWYGPYPGGNVTDPVGPATGIDRVNRGGSFGSGANDERSANRAKNPPNECSAYRGFRVVLCTVQ
jgi:sulfatase modifying factor 1